VSLVFDYIFSWLMGNVIGSIKVKKVEKFMDGIRDRLNHLTYFKVIPPIGVFAECNIPLTFFHEAVIAYLLGLPNSSVLMSVKTLELGLKCRLGVKKGKLRDLIDKVEELEELKDLAHSLRLLRNMVSHEEKSYDEQDALEALRHVSLILDRLYPFNSMVFPKECASCGEIIRFRINKEEFYLGNVIRERCRKCNKINVLIVGEEWILPKVFLKK